MTSKLTREENVQAVFDLKAGYTLGLADVEILKRVARMALAAMDSEPVAWTSETALSDVACEETSMIGQEGVVGSIPLYRHAQPAKGLELAGWQFKSVNGDWLVLIDEYGKNQAVRDGCEVREVFAMADGVNERDQVRREHAEWSQSTFGNVGPIGPLKHLSKEALEAAAEPGDLSEWADMQFLLWDAQRRAGITDAQITQAMIEKLAVNKQREWPESKDGEPRLHIKELPAPVVPDIDELRLAFEAAERESDDGFNLHKYGIGYADDETQGRWDTWLACRAAMLAAAPHDTTALNSVQSVDSVTGGWIKVSEQMPESNGVYFGWDGKRVLEVNCFFGGWSANQFIHGEITHWMPLPAAPQEEKP